MRWFDNQAKIDHALDSNRCAGICTLLGRVSFAFSSSEQLGSGCTLPQSLCGLRANGFVNCNSNPQMIPCRRKPQHIRIKQKAQSERLGLNLDQ